MRGRDRARLPEPDVVAGQMGPERDNDAIRADDDLVLDLIGRNHLGAYNAGSSCSVSCQNVLRGRIEHSLLKAIPYGRYELAVTILVGPARECPPRIEQPPANSNSLPRVDKERTGTRHDVLTG